MNGNELVSLGVPESLIGEAHIAFKKISNNRKANPTFWPSKGQVRSDLKDVVCDPNKYLDNDIWSGLAKGLIEYQNLMASYRSVPPAQCKVWGDGFEPEAIEQINTACNLPVSLFGALMPDAHVGYGLPIGGVLATDGVVIPSAVGVDIACRMRITVLDIDASELKNILRFEECLLKNTFFGIGDDSGSNADHQVMDKTEWGNTKLLKGLKDKAHAQLGTSGSGNHFAEFGEIQFKESINGIDPTKSYVAVMTHSGSRGPGSNICKYYEQIASHDLPIEFSKFRKLAWLRLSSSAGAEYWEAMNLMGEYASANHQIIHDRLIKSLGAKVLTFVENHHNFAWQELHFGKEVIVHRKGATPAGKGVLGVIPGSMASPAYLVRGKGNPDSLNSASHGAGRAMSRSAAKAKFNWEHWNKYLENKGVKLLAAGLDEVPGAYKDIEQVMAAQSDLVDIVAEFNPKIVRMCGEAEDRTWKGRGK